MKKWKIDYAYRKCGKYFEDTIYVSAMYLDAAYSSANSALNSKAWEEGWDTVNNGHYFDRFLIWNAGIMGDADEEVF